MNGAARNPVFFRDLVTFRRRKGAHDERGVVMKVMAGKKIGVMRADGFLMVTARSLGPITVVDRSHFRAGDVVAAVSDPGGQIGVVMGAATALDLVRSEGTTKQAVTTMVARGVSPADLRRVTELSVGDYVVSGSWLGRVVEVSLEVDVLFDDGALCRVTQAERKLEAAGKNYLMVRHPSTIFYPGQRVDGCPSDLKASRWIKGHWKPTRIRGTVAKVHTAGVLVCWVASRQLGTCKALIQASAPHAYQPSPHKLHIFRSAAPEESYWSVGDRCFFRCPDHEHATATDVDAPSAHPQGGCDNSAAQCLRNGGSSSGGDGSSPLLPPSSSSTTCGPMRRHGKRTRMMGVKRRTWRLDQRHAGFERAMSVADTRTTVDVLWQDGTRQCGVPSASLVLFQAQNEHDFIPGQHVVGWAPPSSPDDNASGAVDVHGGGGGGAAADAPAAARFGVVRSLNSKDQTVRVSWLKPATCPVGAAQVDCYDETVSAYDLACNFDQSFFYGDVVIRLGSTKVASSKMPGHDLTWVGHIVDLCGDGHIHVEWGDGNTSKVLPHEIAVVKNQYAGDMVLEIGDWMYGDGEADDPQEDTITQQELIAATDNNDNVEGDEDSGGETDVEDGPEVTRTTTNRICTVARALIRLSSEAFARGKRYLVGGALVAEVSGSELAVTEIVEAATLTSGGDDNADDTAAATGSSSNGGGKAEADAIGDDGPFRFRQFDVVQSPLDHHFLENTDRGFAVGRKWTKRVQKEWKILENDLPDTIYVRAFEDRMDLLRAVMVGASGTPYHDGLFFFDLHLPPTYPAEPPQVNYRSFGLHMNPNLYPSGTVCLSLLNTFGGEGAELWSPEASSVLQVLVSIQGLVLTAQPYYNEPAYGAQAGTPVGRRNELPYSENTCLLSLQTMLHLLRRPPAGFEEFVADHFRRRGQRLLQACDAYLQEGCLVGTLDGEGRATEGSRARPCSAGFRLALLNVLPRLVEAFAGIGVQGCEQFHKFRAPKLSTEQFATR